MNGVSLFQMSRLEESSSLRVAQKEHSLFAMMDVIEDDPATRLHPHPP